MPTTINLDRISDICYVLDDLAQAYKNENTAAEYALEAASKLLKEYDKMKTPMDKKAGRCPVCGNEHSLWYYCPICGQAIGGEGK